nr:MAG TPA: hypothetical protein [Caudoviricetes sp.]
MENVGVRRGNYQASWKIIMVRCPACVHLHIASPCMAP